MSTPDDVMVSDIRLVRRNPVHRSCLINSLLNFHRSVGSNEGCSFVNIRPSRLTVLNSDDVETFFGDDLGSLALFHQSEGILLRTTLSHKFISRAGVVCDVNFWHLWDTIVFSGWQLLDVHAFVSIYGNGVPSHLALVRSMSTFSSSTCRLSSIRLDILSFPDVGYSIFEDICTIFRRFVSVSQWLGGHSFKWAKTKSAPARRLSFAKQVDNLSSMVRCRLPLPVVICHMLEINALCVSSSSGLPSGFLVHDYYHLKSLLIDRLNLVVHSSNLSLMLANLYRYVDVNHL